MAKQVYVFPDGDDRPTRVDASGVVAGNGDDEIYAFEDETSLVPVRKTVTAANSAGDYVYTATDEVPNGRELITGL